MATLIIFLIVLGVLVFVHELGHFLAAKKAGVRVDEFGFGYPPKALSLGKKWGTQFSLNWIPFGGFVKIFGEDYEETPPTPPLVQGRENKIASGVGFVQVSKKWQAGILAAGVIFNILFAWFLFSFGFLIGVPTSVNNEYGAAVKNPVLTIVDVVPDSPAKNAGLKSGDKIEGVSLPGGETLKNLDSKTVSDFISQSNGAIKMKIDRGGEILDFEILPETDIVEGRKLIGVSMDMVGTLALPLHKAVYEGGRATINISSLTVKGLANLIGQAFVGRADLSQVAGPVGIVGLVGDASRLGFAYLVTFTALISINLAIINLLPFPALDGGRIVVVAIEALTKRRMNPKIIHTINTIGFFLLIALMLIITYRDVLKLF